MKVLIVEDEARIAKRLKRMVETYFEDSVSVVTCDSLAKGVEYFQYNSVDLLLLDLNLNGENGFDVLGAVVSSSFHTIVVSANTDRAMEAFSYGVLDFVAKPFDQSRLFLALNRLRDSSLKAPHQLRFLAIKKTGVIKLFDIANVLYIKGAGIYSEIHLKDGKTELHDKSLDNLQQLLSISFERIHKSYLVDMDAVEKIEVHSGSRYHALLKNGELLPIGRSRYNALREKFL